MILPFSYLTAMPPGSGGGPWKRLTVTLPPAFVFIQHERNEKGCFRGE
jgi:hypothetical protein